MLKRYLPGLLLLAAAPLAAQAQTGSVGIGTTTPAASAALEIKSTSQGLLLPRLTLAQRTALTASPTAPPVPGLVIYQTDNTPGLYAYDGAAWVRLGADNLGNHLATQALDLGPNPLVGNGGTAGLTVSSGGSVGIGTSTPGQLLDVNGSAAIGGNAYVNGGQGVLLNQQDRPLITRGWDAFASGAYQGAGRWGLFMEPSTLAFGVPALGGKSFQWVRYNDNSTVASALMTLTQDGNLGLGTPTPGQKLEVAGTVYSSSGGFQFPDGTTQTTAAATSSGDNLGNHTATQSLDLGANALVGTGADLGTAVGLGVRADGGLNLAQNTPGNNLFVGYQTGPATTFSTSSITGSSNQLVGYQSGYNNTSGFRNLFSGYQSGFSTKTGYRNQFTGYQSGYGAISFGSSNPTENQFSGYQSGYSIFAGSQNLFTGYQSGYTTSQGFQNQFMGYQSGYWSRNSNSNQFDGFQSGFYNVSGSQNQFSGYQSGYNSLEGNNQFNGYQSGYNLVYGKFNLFIGYQTGYNSTGTGNGVGSPNYNTLIGYQSGYSTGYNFGTSYNTFLGYRTGYLNTTGSFNTLMGHQSGYRNTTGGQNTFLGYQSGYNATTGSDNVALGAFAGPADGFGNLTNSIAIGSYALVTRSNSMALGGDGSSSRPAVNVGIGTSAPAYPLDVNGPARVGTSSTPATVYGPTTGTHNLLAVAYGQLGGTGSTVISSSDNYVLTRTGTGTYTITLNSTSGLSSYRFDRAVVTVSLYNAIGFVTWTGGTGVINVKTYDSSGAANDQVFTFAAFQP